MSYKNSNVMIEFKVLREVCGSGGGTETGGAVFTIKAFPR